MSTDSDRSGSLLPTALERSLVSRTPTLWLNEHWRSFDRGAICPAFDPGEMYAAEDLLRQYAVLLRELFPELESTQGIIESPLLWRRMVGKDEVEIDRETRHVAHEQVDRRATLQREGVILEHQRCNLRQQTRSIEIDRIHDLSTRRPLANRDTQGRSLPVGNVDESSLAAQGSEPSRPSWRHSRTVLTLVQCCSSLRSTSARGL